MAEDWYATRLHTENQWIKWYPRLRQNVYVIPKMIFIPVLYGIFWVYTFLGLHILLLDKNNSSTDYSIVCYEQYNEIFVWNGINIIIQWTEDLYLNIKFMYRLLRTNILAKVLNFFGVMWSLHRNEYALTVKKQASKLCPLCWT